MGGRKAVAHGSGKYVKERCGIKIENSYLKNIIINVNSEPCLFWTVEKTIDDITVQRRN